MLGNNDEHEKARLTSWLIEQRRLGEGCPQVSAKSIEEAVRRRPLSPRERADRLLRYIASDLSHIADQFSGRLYDRESECQRRLAWSECVRVDELDYLMDYLEGQGWIEEIYDLYRLSVNGHARLAAIDESLAESSKLLSSRGHVSSSRISRTGTTGRGEACTMKRDSPTGAASRLYSLAAKIS